MMICLCEHTGFDDSLFRANLSFNLKLSTPGGSLSQDYFYISDTIFGNHQHWDLSQFQTSTLEWVPQRSSPSGSTKVDDGK